MIALLALSSLGLNKWYNNINIYLKISKEQLLVKQIF